MAELSARPFPPGEYPVVVVGSGPGALQVVVLAARASGVDHAVISADPSPGGMFRRWPFFQRLLSWTKPYAPGRARQPRLRALRLEQPARATTRTAAAIQPGLMDGTSYFPSRPEMEANLAPFAERAGVADPLRLPLDRRPAASRTPDGERFELETTDGDYRCRVADRRRRRRRAVHAARRRAWSSPTTTPTSARSRRYADRRVLIIGKQNSGFELATGLLPWARQIVLVSPSQAKLSVDTKTLVGVRARYVQPYEDHVLGGGVSVLDAAIDRIERGRRRAADRLPAPDRRRAPTSRIEVDDVISATGFVCPLLDLPDLGRHDVRAEPAAGPDAVVGERHGARHLLRRDDRAGREGPPEARRAGQLRRRPRRALQRPGPGRPHRRRRASASSRSGRTSRPTRSPGFVATELAEAPELFHQRGYLARVLTADPAGGMRDEGVQPLAHVLDGGGPDALAATLEADGSGAIYPVVYTRIGGKVVEQAIEPDPLMRFDTVDARRTDRRARRAGDGPLTVAPAQAADVARRGPRRVALGRRRSVSVRFGNANRSFVRPSSGSREERRAGHGRDARIADEPQGEGDVVLAVGGQVGDVGHHVVGAGRLVDAEAGRRAGPAAAGRAGRGSRRRGPRSTRPGSPSATTAAACSGAAAPTVRKSWTRRIPTDRSGGAIVQPIRQPVTEYVFDIEWIETVRSAIPGSVASGMCSPSNTMCS